MTEPKRPQDQPAEAYAAEEAVLDAIDWSQARFPSNRRTFQQIRSHIIAVEKVHDPEEVGRILEALGNAQREVLGRGILRGLGYPPLRHANDPDGDGAEHFLADLYQETGIARGRHEAMQLVEQLSNWAAGEARKHAPGRLR